MNIWPGVSPILYLQFDWESVCQQQNRLTKWSGKFWTFLQCIWPACSTCECSVFCVPILIIMQVLYIVKWWLYGYTNPFYALWCNQDISKQKWYWRTEQGELTILNILLTILLARDVRQTHKNYKIRWSIFLKFRLDDTVEINFKRRHFPSTGRGFKSSLTTMLQLVLVTFSIIVLIVSVWIEYIDRYSLSPDQECKNIAGNCW